MAKINIHQLDRYAAEFKSYEKINKKNGKNKSQDGEDLFQSPGKPRRRGASNDY